MEYVSERDLPEIIRLCEDSDRIDATSPKAMMLKEELAKVQAVLKFNQARLHLSALQIIKDKHNELIQLAEIEKAYNAIKWKGFVPKEVTAHVMLDVIELTRRGSSENKLASPEEYISALTPGNESYEDLFRKIRFFPASWFSVPQINPIYHNMMKPLITKELDTYMRHRLKVALLTTTLFHNNTEQPVHQFQELVTSPSIHLIEQVFELFAPTRKRKGLTALRVPVAKTSAGSQQEEGSNRDSLTSEPLVALSVEALSIIQTFRRENTGKTGNSDYEYFVQRYRDTGDDLYIKLLIQPTSASDPEMLQVIREINMIPASWKRIYGTHSFNVTTTGHDVEIMDCILAWAANYLQPTYSEAEKAYIADILQNHSYDRIIELYWVAIGNVTEDDGDACQINDRGIDVLANYGIQMKKWLVNPVVYFLPMMQNSIKRTIHQMDADVDRVREAKQNNSPALVEKYIKRIIQTCVMRLDAIDNIFPDLHPRLSQRMFDIANRIKIEGIPANIVHEFDGDWSVDPLDEAVVTQVLDKFPSMTNDRGKQMDFLFFVGMYFKTNQRHFQFIRALVEKDYDKRIDLFAELGVVPVHTYRNDKVAQPYSYESKLRGALEWWYGQTWDDMPDNIGSSFMDVRNNLYLRITERRRTILEQINGFPLTFADPAIDEQYAVSMQRILSQTFSMHKDFDHEFIVFFMYISKATDFNYLSWLEDTEITKEGILQLRYVPIKRGGDYELPQELQEKVKTRKASTLKWMQSLLSFLKQEYGDETVHDTIETLMTCTTLTQMLKKSMDKIPLNPSSLKTLINRGYK